MQHKTQFALLIPVLLLESGCGALTHEEAQQALEEIEISSQAQALTSSSVEISTNFTIGDAVKNAAAELKTFIESQMPCAEATLQGNQLHVEYGANEGTCVYRGQTYQGSHTIIVSRNDEDDVVVDHIWEQFQNQTVMLNGTATVTWSLGKKTRHVVHNAEWTRLEDGRVGEGSGDRVQTALDGNIFDGFSVDGERHWHGESGDWDLDIDEVEMRWIDSVPQSGAYTLDTPFNKQLSVSFDRTGTTQIQVTISGPRKSFDFKVNTLPEG